MSIQMVLLPVFVQVGLTFALLLGWRVARQCAGQRRDEDPGYRAGPAELAARGPTQIGNCYRNQFEVPVLFYVLIALALAAAPRRSGHRDAVLGVRGDALRPCRRSSSPPTTLGQRSIAWLAGVLVLLAMWIYFALKILLSDLIASPTESFE